MQKIQKYNNVLLSNISMSQEEEEDFEYNKKNKKQLNVQSQKYSRKLKISSEGFKAIEKSEKEQQTENFISKLNANESISKYDLQTLLGIQSQIEINKDINQEQANKIEQQNLLTNCVIAQQNCQNLNIQKSTIEQSQNQEQKLKQNNMIKMQSPQKIESQNQEFIFNLNKSQLSPEKYFEFELYPSLPEIDELNKLEVQFLKCMSCECCKGNVDECQGETCLILGQCYCYSQMETEEKNQNIDCDDYYLIEQTMNQIENDFDNWYQLENEYKN